MANRNYRSSSAYGYAAYPVSLRMKVSIGAAGAPTIASGTGMGITSITHNSAGDYSILLNNPYTSLMGVHVVFNSGASAPAAPLVNIESDAVATAAAPILRLQCRDIAAAAADPASGEIMHIEILLNNSPQAY